MKTILVTGGLGFIGSHCSWLLADKGYKVIAVDNLVNTSAQVATKISNLLTDDKKANFEFVELDLRDKAKLEQVFAQNSIDAVIHFAALKAVGESVSKPLEYYNNNVYSTIVLLEVMEQFKVNLMVYSSSATTYGNSTLPFREDQCPLAKASSPYGQTKVVIERMLEDVTYASDLRAVRLRYFNPVGAHESGLLGEELHTPPLNIFPIISEAYLGIRDKVYIFGDDYPTKDGTCERDYIHIMDLVEAHLDALNYLEQNLEVKCEAFNVGTGIPLSVREILETYNQFSDVKIKYEVGPRRAGDIP